MPLETGTQISDLVSTNPAATDEVSKADDHLRLIKAVLKTTFPNLNGVVSATLASLNSAAGTTMAALSVWGRSANSVGAPAEIVAAADGNILRRSGTAVGFGNAVLTAVDITGATSKVTPLVTDELAGYDIAGAGAKKFVISNFFKTITGLTSKAVPLVTDEIAGYDVSGTAGAKFTISNLFKAITGLTSKATPVVTDEVPIYDVSGTAGKKVVVSALLGCVTGLTEDLTPDSANDFLLTYDTSATSAKKVKPQNIVPIGSVVQVVNTQTGAVSSGSTVIPLDDTIPQSSEGNQVMSLAITPQATANKLMIDVVVHCTTSAGATRVITAGLFQDATANALAAGSVEQFTSGTGEDLIVFRHFMAAGTVSSTTFKVRIGPDSAATVTFNGQSAARLFGGVLASSITITEIKA